MLLQQKIDDVLEGVHLSDLLHDERDVRERVGLADAHRARRRHALPILRRGAVPFFARWRARARSAAQGGGVRRGALRASRMTADVDVARSERRPAAMSTTRDGSCATRAARSGSSLRSATRSTIARRRSVAREIGEALRAIRTSPPEKPRPPSGSSTRASARIGDGARAQGRSADRAAAGTGAVRVRRAAASAPGREHRSRARRVVVALSRPRRTRRCARASARRRCPRTCRRQR